MCPATYYMCVLVNNPSCLLSHFNGIIHKQGTVPFLYNWALSPPLSEVLQFFNCDVIYRGGPEVIHLPVRHLH